MSRELTSENIDYIENFIKDKPEKITNLAISNFGLQRSTDYLSNIDKKAKNSYYIFDSASCGYSSYAIYKSSSNDIYIVSISMQNLTGYMSYRSFIENNCNEDEKL